MKLIQQIPGRGFIARVGSRKAMVLGKMKSMKFIATEEGNNLTDARL